MIKKTFGNQYILLFMVLLLSAAVFFCGEDHFGHQNALSSEECSGIISDIIAPIKENAYLALAFVFGLAAIFTAAVKIVNQKSGRVAFNFRKRWQFIYRLFDPVFLALKRGLLKPKIYNPTFAQASIAMKLFTLD